MRFVQLLLSIVLMAVSSTFAIAADAPEAAKLYFAVGKADLPKDSDKVLGAVVEFLKANPDMKAQISGFTDKTGSAEKNEELAKNRAKAVRAALTAAGIAEERVIMKKPEMITGSGANKEARRVEVTAVAAEAPAAAPAEAPAAEPEKPAAPVAAAPAPAAEPAAAAAPVPDKGDTTWMIVATVLVILMTIPGLALFYGGMVRAKNMLSILMQVFATFSLLAVLWGVYGYSVAFSEGNAFFGGFSKAFLHGVTSDSAAATFSKGVVIPEYIYIAFQLTFAAITPALIIGAFAERIKFSAVLLFMVLWFTFSYLPIAHMVWYWSGPDAFTSAEAGAKANELSGFLWSMGALDFAGGTVVHINAGIAGLVGCLVLGKRVGFGRDAMQPHSLTMTMVGASLLWVGWFGFNVGSNLEATGFAAMVFVNTLLATAAAALAWMFAEWALKGKPSMLGIASGAIAGLVAITPACGFVGPMGGIILGIIAGLICLWAVTSLKHMFGYDDSLDVFGVHCVGGIIGALGTAIFCAPSLGGTGVYDYVANAVGADYSIAAQFWIQLKAVITCLVWSGVVAFVTYKITDLIIGLRVPEELEREGLDIREHGEVAYHY